MLGLGAGLERAGLSLDAARSTGSPRARATLDRLLTEARASPDDLSAVRLLSYSGPTAIDTLVELVDARHGEQVPLAAVRALARYGDPRIAERLVAFCPSAAPNLQVEIIQALASRAAWTPALLEACRRGDVAVGLIPQATRAALLRSDDAKTKQQAEKLFGAASPRAEVIARYESALALRGDSARGDKVFERECAGCHQLGQRGHALGPNLALIRNRTPQALIEAILDPNRDVAPNYVSYVLVDDSGRTTTGLILSETAASLTIGRDKGVTETIQKQNIDQLKATGMSLMPEGLEKTIDPQSMADLLAFLASVQYDMGTLPDFAAPE